MALFYTESMHLDSDTAVMSVIKSVKNKKWIEAPLDHVLATFIKNRTALPHVVAEILARRNISPDDTAAFLNPKLKDSMPNPSVLKDMDIAVAITTDAVRTGKQIAVFGDYDVDGATSSALLIRTLKAIGLESVRSYIPDRAAEGYGLNTEAVKTLKDSGTELLITVDCGSSSYEAVELAKHLGLQVIVIDHHMCEVVLPTANAIINPNRQDDSSGLGYLAAVGVSFLFVVALIKHMVKGGYLNSTQVPDLILFLDLVALGTVCDVAPLKGLNRVMVKHGLKIIDARINRGIKALLEASGVGSDQQVSIYHLGFVLGPKINAGGRVGQADLGTKLLTCDDPRICQELAVKLGMYNHERRAIENQILEEALLKAAFVGKDAPVVCVCGDDWHLGVIGIIAARIKERLDKPAIVIAMQADGTGRASCRSIKGIDMGASIMDAKAAELIIVGGGHEMAAGFTVYKEKIEPLRAFLSAKFAPFYKEIIANAVSYYEAAISLESITPEFVLYVEKVGPFGNGNEQPRFMLSSVSVVSAKILKGEHVSCILKDFSNKDSNKTLKAMCFRGIQTSLGEVLLSSRGPIDLIVTISLNKWQGRESAEAVIHDAIVKRN